MTIWTQYRKTSLSALAVMAALGLGGGSAFGHDVTEPADTAAAVAAAKWSDTVTISFDEAAATFRYQSNGIPDHGFAEKYLIPNDVGSMPFSDNTVDEFTVVNSADYFTETSVDATITTQPHYSDQVTDTSLGRIGVTISGAQLFNDYEDFDRQIAALDDNVTHDHVSFVDACNGHTLVDGTNYHYHGIPLCISQTLDQAGEHSSMLGVLEDGFPAYSNQGAAGAIMTDGDLDECSGHYGETPEFPDGIYHYHLTADEAPYSVDCYHGEVAVADAMAAPDNGGGGGPDLAAAAQTLGVDETALRDALGMPPDFASAAETLGISVDDLMTALPGPQQ
ncbi:YHYH protein [Devosia algicola]|uniref:YHYH protein n=1 Tax=Devosia algicola TaxID=3026418 RepID=A0ABY7YN19_9HYPH|nr:YHYH protein [Devosia algicola]WDR02708.1 YHYH protein [Devosia algicola]